MRKVAMGPYCTRPWIRQCLRRRPFTGFPFYTGLSVLIVMCSHELISSQYLILFSITFSTSVYPQCSYY